MDLLLACDEGGVEGDVGGVPLLELVHLGLAGLAELRGDDKEEVAVFPVFV